MKNLFKDMEKVHFLLLFFIVVFALMGLLMGNRDTKWNRWWHEK